MILTKRVQNYIHISNFLACMRVLSKIFYKFQDNLIQGVAMPLVRKIVSKQAYLLNFATVLF